MIHQNSTDLQFFDKCDFGPTQSFFNNLSPFYLPETKSIPVDRAWIALSPGGVV